MRTDQAGAGPRTRAGSDRPRVEFPPRLVSPKTARPRLARLPGLTPADVGLLGALVFAMLLWGSALRLRLSYDEGVYAETARLVARGHPLFFDVFTSQPPLWPVFLVPGWVVGGVTTTRLWVAMWGLAGLAAMYRIARHYLPRRLSLGVVVLVAACPGYALLAAAIEGEVPAITLALWSLVVALSPSRPVLRSFASGVLLGLGLMVKLLVAPMGVVVLVALLTAGPRPKQLRLGQTAAYLAGIVGIAGVCVGWWHGAQFWDQVVGLHVSAQGGIGGLKANLHQALLSTFTVLFLVAGTAAAGWLLTKRSTRLALPVLWITAVDVFLVLHVPLFAHHLALAVPPAALLLALALQQLPSERWRTWGLTIAIVATVLVSAVDVARSPGRQTAADTPAVAALDRLPRGAVVVTDDQTLAVEADRAVPGPLVDTSNVRIRAGALSPTTVCQEVARADAVLLTTGGRFSVLPGVARCTAALMHVAWRDSGGVLYRR